jgi:hypothetical protein
MDLRPRGRGWIPAALAFFLAAGWAAERAAWLRPLRQALRDPTVPAAMLNRGSVGNVFRHLRLVRPVPNDKQRHKPSVHPKTALDASLFQKKRVIGTTLYLANPGWVEDLASRPELPPPAVAPGLFREGWPLVAVAIDWRDLTGAKWGILPNFWGRGREWERPAGLAYYSAGRLQVATRASVRLHGGDSRLPGNTHSFRVYFREGPDRAAFPRGVLFGPESEPIERLIIRADWPASHPFAGLLAYDVTARIGGVVPHTQPVVFVLNGRLQTNIYHLSEHVSRAAWAKRIGHRDFLMYFMKAQQEAQADRAYGELRTRVVFDPPPLELAAMEERVDLDNLSANILATAYAGTTDGFQGAGLLDRRAARPRWSWITWDMDHSFWDVYGAPDGSPREIWRQESWELVFKRPGDRNYPAWRRRGDVRAVLFARLMEESPAFRDRFLRYVVEMLNHRLTDGFLEGRIAHYEGLARSFGRTDLAFAEDYRRFVRQRPEVLRAGLQRLFETGPVRRVEVRVPPEAELLIDGHESQGPYAGWYFEGQTVTVSWNGEPPAGFRGWQVDGRPAGEESVVQLAADRDRVIAPVGSP